MLRKFVIMLALLSLLPLAGCAQLERGYAKIKNNWDERPQKGIYTVFGRVFDQQSKPVQNCSVYLIKRKFDLVCDEPDNCNLFEAKTVGEFLVAQSDVTGDYQFIFEPLEANNIWVYFHAEGYAPRMIEMDKMMHGKLIRNPGRILAHYNIVLDPQRAAAVAAN